jgi:SAM-dependent methyltransferase
MSFPGEPQYIDQKIRVDLIMETLKKAGGAGRGKVLEVGCGDGHLSGALSRAGYTVYATDVPGSNLPAGPSVFVADGRRLPVVSNEFDYTVTSEVLEHVPPDGRQQFLEELVRVTRPGGLIILTAFVRRTFAFRLWGAAWLIASPKGGLPTWYCEHVMMPPPTAVGIEQTFSSLSTKVLSKFDYFGAIGMWVMWIQNATGWMWLTKYIGYVRPFCNIGGKISCLVVAEKPAAAETPRAA